MESNKMMEVLIDLETEFLASRLLEHTLRKLVQILLQLIQLL